MPNQKYWGPIQALLKSSSITIQNQIAKDIPITEQRYYHVPREQRQREYFLSSMAGWLSSCDISWQDKLIDVQQSIRWMNLDSKCPTADLAIFPSWFFPDRTSWYRMKMWSSKGNQRSYQHQLLTSNMQYDTSWLIYDLINEIFNHWFANALMASTLSSKIRLSIE